MYYCIIEIKENYVVLNIIGISRYRYKDIYRFGGLFVLYMPGWRGLDSAAELGCPRGSLPTVDKITSVCTAFHLIKMNITWIVTFALYTHSFLHSLLTPHFCNSSFQIHTRPTLIDFFPFGLVIGYEQRQLKEQPQVRSLGRPRSRRGITTAAPTVVGHCSFESLPEVFIAMKCLRARHNSETYGRVYCDWCVADVVDRIIAQSCDCQILSEFEVCGKV